VGIVRDRERTVLLPVAVCVKETLIVHESRNAKVAQLLIG